MIIIREKRKEKRTRKLEVKGRKKRENNTNLIENWSLVENIYMQLVKGSFEQFF